MDTKVSETIVAGVKPVKKVSPTRFDWFVYRLFLKRWNPILASNPGMAIGFARYMRDWIEYNLGEGVCAESGYVINKNEYAINKVPQEKEETGE